MSNSGICHRLTSSPCVDDDDDSAALTLKLVAISAILFSGISGIAIPLIGKNRRFLSTDGNLFIAAKAFAAGVILATGFVHMLPDGSANLSNPCLPEFPWSKFPFSGFATMVAALLTLVADFVGTQLYERKQEKKNEVLVEPVADGLAGPELKGNEEDGGSGMHVVGMYAHATQHGHTHGPGHGPMASSGLVIDGSPDGHGHVPHGDGHGGEDVDNAGRHAIISQVLELGIVSHSVIIGLSLGVSHSPCAIRPLIVALSFHQFFEGFALGGCIAQAQFKILSTVVMALFFAITNPFGIAVGIGIASSYNPNRPRALVIEGILDCASAGILIYMSLVDLIAADFLSKRMRCSVRLQIVSCFALFLGALLMSSLAIWS